MRESFTNPEMTVLNRLRQRFLDGSNVGGGYWESLEDLELYDVTFGERIGWKWDAVLGELITRKWIPQSRHVLDWGCGSGIAGRRVLEAWPEMERLSVLDVSPRAVEFASKKARTDFPKVKVQAHSGDTLPPDTLLVISHALNELTPRSRESLLALARQAREILWVEAGTHADSHRLISVREELKTEFSVVAPCPHQVGCGMLTPGNERHWCHFFGRVPSAAFQDAQWAQFARDLGIDLGTLPYSFLVMERPRPEPFTPPGSARVIGRPNEETKRMEVLACRECGVGDLLLQKRDVPALYKDLHKGRAAAVQRWTVEDGKIVGAIPTENECK